jgi:hypothetical protein
MKHLIIAALLVSIGVQAEEAAKAKESAETTPAPKHTYPTLDELWNQTETGSELKKALADGTPSAEVMFAYEHSDLDDNGTKAAHAVLTRTRLNYLTGTFRGFDAFIQAQYVGPINDHYSHQFGGNVDYDTVADPEKFRLHQGYLAYSGYNSDIRLGAQEIILDDARFIGNVGWRLNAQSFNAVSIANQCVDNLTLYYAYADSINTIDGESEHDRQYHLFNGEYKLNENNKLSGFAYLQRNDLAGSPDTVDTFGIRSWGKNNTLSHNIMAALQRDAIYAHAFGEVALSPINAGLGVEYISGGDDSRDRFQTLNGTGHKFNGWADQFLGTGGGLEGGLIDAYAQLSAQACKKVKLVGVYHYFHTADETATGFDGEYGQEIDALAKYSVCKNFDLLAKAAYYVKGENNGDNFTNDETVFWLRGTLKF